MVDYFRRPKLAYFAVTRELASLVVASQRKLSSKNIFSTDSTGGTTTSNTTNMPTLEIWASNFSQVSNHVAVHIVAWNLETGAEIHRSVLQKDLTLLPNRSTEIVQIPLPLALANQFPSTSATVPPAASTSAASTPATPKIHTSWGTSISDVETAAFRTVVAVYLFPVGTDVSERSPITDSTSRSLHRSPSPIRPLARCINWPEPLRYAHLADPTPDQLRVRVVPSPATPSHRSPDSTDVFPLAVVNEEPTFEIEISSTVPVKGLEVEAPRSDEVVWADNGVDVVPGETLRLRGRGLRKEDEEGLVVRWLK